MLSHSFEFVNNFFHLFFSLTAFVLSSVLYLITLLSICQAVFLFIFSLGKEEQKNNHLEKETEKEGFEPSRRLPDLHP